MADTKRGRLINYMEEYMKHNALKRQSGFSLVELSVVIVIIGVLAAFAVPKFRDSVERSKASEAYNYLSAVRTSQERYQSKEGTYATDSTTLDIQIPAPKYFTVGEIAAGVSGSMEDSWKLTLSRKGPSAGYGEYTITFSQDGFVEDESTIKDIPAINPMSQ